MKTSILFAAVIFTASTALAQLPLPGQPIPGEPAAKPAPGAKVMRLKMSGKDTAKSATTLKVGEQAERRVLFTVESYERTPTAADFESFFFIRKPSGEIAITRADRAATIVTSRGKQGLAAGCKAPVPIVGWYGRLVAGGVILASDGSTPEFTALGDNAASLTRLMTEVQTRLAAEKVARDQAAQQARAARQPLAAPAAQ